MKEKKINLKVLTYNIHKGFNPTNTRFVLNKIRDGIRTLGADIVLLQEVIGKNIRHEKNHAGWPSEGQFEYLADKVWPHHAYGKNAVYQEGHHGNAILSKYPVIEWENIDVSTNSFEQRGILHAKINIPEVGLPIHIICLHLGLMESGRNIQVNMLCQRIKEHVPDRHPLIIGGDFNDWRQKLTNKLKSSLTVQEAFLELQGKHAKSFPSFLPGLTLDRMYFRDLKPLSAEVVTSIELQKLSDHIPLLVQFETICHTD